MFKNNQTGFTFLELLAYLAIYGTISAAIVAGISAMLNESNVKYDLGEITLVEKEIRGRAAMLNNFSTDKAKSPLLATATNYKDLPNTIGLQGFLCVNGFSFCQTKGSKDSSLQTSHGTEFTILDPNTVSYTLNNIRTTTGYSFAIKFVNLPYNYCVGFADNTWNNDIIGLGIGDGSNTTFYPYGVGADNETSGKDPSTLRCPKGDNATFIIYYR